MFPGPVPIMSKLHQVQLKYEPTEDRGLLRIKTQDQQELSFWLTRRFTKGLWALLMRLLEADSQVVSQQDQRAKSALLSFKHEEAISRSDFSTGYQESEVQTAVAQAPLLVIKAEGKVQKDGKRLLRLHPNGGHVVQLVLDDSLLHSLCKIISDMVRMTDWDMELNVGESVPVEEEEPRLLN